LKYVYWIIRGNLAGRPGPWDQTWDLDEIKAKGGFKAIVFLGHAAGEAIGPSGIEHVELGFEGLDSPTVKEMIRFNEQMEALQLVRAIPILVCCNDGESGTATMLASRLIWLGSSVEEAIKRIRKAKPEITLSDKQVEVLGWFASARREVRHETKEKLLPRMSAGPNLVLKECIGWTNALMRVRTGNRSRWKTRTELKEQLEGWMLNGGFDPYRRESLDIAIVAKLDKKRMANQDIDNIAKRVLDALGKRRDEPTTIPHLFEDDSQVARLLALKLPRKEIANFATDEVIISFRRHDPKLQMILKSQTMV